MIPKSVKRFSDKIMRKKNQSLRNTTLANQPISSAIIAVTSP